MRVEHRVSSRTGMHMRTLNCDEIDYNFKFCQNAKQTFFLNTTVNVNFNSYVRTGRLKGVSGVCIIINSYELSEDVVETYIGPLPHVNPE